MTNKYGFILINPQLGENIGASARALKNFGFKNLLITKPRDGWPNVKAKATSVGAVDVLNKTEFLYISSLRHLQARNLNVQAATLEDAEPNPD